MKNFYEVTDIDISNLLKVEIKLKEHDDPIYEFLVNNKPITTDFTIFLSLLETVLFECKVLKGAVEVEKIFINNKEILPLYQHHALPSTTWITNNWQLRIPGPFYPWYHEITGQGWIA